jgi:MFS family permease
VKRLRWYDFLSINLFWLGLNIRNTAVGTFLTPYLVAGFVAESNRNTALGAINTAGLVIAMLAQPAFGLLSDRNTSRFGRRRPYIFAGVLFDLVFLAAMGLAGSYWALLAVTLLIQLSSNVSHGPLQGLIPDLVPEDQRGRASAVKAFMELLPIILVGLTVGSLLAAGELGWAIVVTGAGLLVTMLLTMLLVHEQPLKEKPATPFWPPMVRVLGMLAGIVAGAAAGLLVGGAVGGVAALIARPLAGKPAAMAAAVGIGGIVAMVVAMVAGVWAGALATLGQDARRHASFTWWIVNRLMFLASLTSIRSFALFFLMYAFAVTREQASGMTGALINMVGVSTLISALGGGWLADRLGHKRLVGISAVTAAGGAFMLLGTIWAPNLALIYAAGVVLGLSAGLFMTANWALGTDLVPPAEAGRYLGISNLAGAGAGIIGTGIGGLMADTLNGYRPGLGYFAIFAGFAIILVLSAVTLAGVRRPTRPAEVTWSS